MGRLLSGGQVRWSWCSADVSDRFGAVMEEFEVRDALENVFSMKGDFGMVY
jgi:hypothetical protein